MNGTSIEAKRFGRLVVLSLLGKTTARPGRRSRIIWTCRCDCGNRSLVEHWQLLRGKTKSCGCLRRELSSIRKRGRKARAS